MIRFEKLRWKNFLSTGNYFTQIDFLASPTNLIVGANGAGKSTMLDALSFALFGKPHRSITKGQLPNSINNKDCTVEVTFTVGGISYRVVRGIKPNKFEIWKDSVMINQNSHSKEYQDILEKNILQMSHKSFHQIVVLGSSSFVPFMQLNSTSRRDVIEDLLDINIFSKMNVILKEKVALLKTSIEDNNHHVEVTKTKINAQKKYIRDLTAINMQHRKDKEAEIEDYRRDIESLNDENSTLNIEVNELLDTVAEFDKVKESRSKLREYNSTFKTQVNTVVKEAKFFDQHTHCPTCDQDIGEELRSFKKKEANDKAKKLNEAMTKAKVALDDYDARIADMEATHRLISSKQNQISNNISTITRLNNGIDRVLNDIANLADSAGDMGQANKDLYDLEAELLDLVDQKYLLNEQASYNRIAGELLRDSGIKTKIIKQYVPVINDLTNKYLKIMDFFVHFELDENFNETIRSRYRDAFTYASFSEGEKQRIDLSLLFTWRQIAKMKNSVSTNLLVLDETFDSSLDGDGVDNLMMIIESLKEDTNVFVISHKGELEDAAFERKIQFYKEKNFSRMKDIT